MSLLSFFCMMYSSSYLIGCLFLYGHMLMFYDMMCCSFDLSVFSLAHCGLEAWPIMGDIEPISLGLEIWLREFETVTHLLMIRVVPCSLPALWLCFDLHPSIMSFAQHHPWDHYMTFPSSVFLALHIPSLIRPCRVWGVWAQGWSYMERVYLMIFGWLTIDSWLVDSLMRLSLIFPWV